MIIKIGTKKTFIQFFNFPICLRKGLNSFHLGFRINNDKKLISKNKFNLKPKKYN